MLKNLRIGWKLGVGFGTVLLLLALLAAYSYFGYSEIRGKVSVAQEAGENRASAIAKEVDHLTWMAKLSSVFLDDSVTEVGVQTDPLRCGLGQWLYSEKTQKAAKQDDDLGQILHRIEEPHRRLHESAIRINEALDSRAGRESALSIYERDTRAAVTEVQAILGELMKYYADQSTTAATATAEVLDSLTITTVILSLAALLVGFWAAFAITRMITRPVGEISDLAKALSEGDIRRRVEFRSRDEIGALADSFRKLIDHTKELSGAAERIAANDLTITIEPKSDADVLGNSFKTMTQNLIGMIRQMGDGATQLVSAANEVASSSEQMSRGAKDQTDQMAQVSRAVEEMTATIVQTSKNSSEASGGARRAADTATSGGQIVSDTIQGMQRIATVVRESAQSIGKLAKSADQIGEIIGVIDDIADQTNLLALNAAIEAARAGEQGRGFAVVADEVRKLAERTGKATGEITNMIKGIQTETEEAVHSMESGIQEVDNGRELADKAGTSLNEIVTMSQQVQDMIQQIATASEEQSTAAEQISKNVENVSSIARESATGAQQSAAAAEELNRQAEAMRQMVAKFRISQDARV
ncbi:MAG: methyl-accepting chemotaxis protein [Candidatus Zixiibacteriota bacterium]